MIINKLGIEIIEHNKNDFIIFIQDKEKFKKEFLFYYKQIVDNYEKEKELWSRKNKQIDYDLYVINSMSLRKSIRIVDKCYYKLIRLIRKEKINNIIW